MANNNEGNSPFKKRIGGVVLLVVSLHILLSIVSLMLPDRLVSSNPLTSTYSKLILLGPFFEESRIKTSAHLLVSYKVDGKWSTPVDRAKENFAYYVDHPWRYDKLRYCDFERYLARQLSGQPKARSLDSVKNTRIFRELNQYMVHETVYPSVDSMQIVYYVNTYFPAEQMVKPDTLFMYLYDPNTISSAKIP